MAIRLVVHGPSTALSSPARAFVFDQPRITLGRAASSDVLLPHPSVSVSHATIQVEGAGYVLTDEGSTNGTRVDSVKLPPTRPKRLADGNLLQIGAFAVKVEILATSADLTDAKTAARAARALLLDALAAEGRPTEAPRLVLTEASGERTRELSLADLAFPATIGRDPSASIQLDDPAVSRVHARLSKDDEVFVIEDQEGEGGVVFEGKRVRRRRLRSRDVFSLGGVSIQFFDPVEDELEALRSSPDVPGEPPLPSTDGSSSPAAPLASPPPPPEAERAADEPPLAEAPPSWRPESPGRRERASGPGTSDAVVFMLAGAMIALSFVGLYLLFGDF